MRKKMNKKGFTLVELIVVIAILAVLAALAVPMVSGWIGQAETSQQSANKQTVLSAANVAVAEVAAGTATNYVEALKNILGGNATVTPDATNTTGKATVSFAKGPSVTVEMTATGVKIV